MIEIPRIESEEIARLRQAGKRGNDILASLQKNIKLIDVIANTQIGHELLDELLKRAEELLDIVANPEKEATIAEKAEYKNIRMIIEKWAYKIEVYLRTVGTIQKESEKIRLTTTQP
jgi:hypothetical protein